MGLDLFMLYRNKGVPDGLTGSLQPSDATEEERKAAQQLGVNIPMLRIARVQPDLYLKLALIGVWFRTIRTSLTLVC